MLHRKCECRGGHGWPGAKIRCLAVSYSHMGRPHTTIGAERIHFRVRNGIGWFPLAMAARQTSWGSWDQTRFSRFGKLQAWLPKRNGADPGSSPKPNNLDSF